MKNIPNSTDGNRNRTDVECVLRSTNKFELSVLPPAKFSCFSSLTPKFGNDWFPHGIATP
jgi:hypothetical protein